MKQTWKLKSGTETTIEQVVLKNSGQTASELLTPKKCFVAHLKDVASCIKEGIAKNKRFFVFGDYDADGVTSAAILCRLLTLLGAQHTCRLPKRFSEGYGLNAETTKQIISKRPDIVITIDNGIVAVDEVKTLVDAGIDVIIIDHHLRRDDNALPPAHIIVDPSALPGSEFDGFCGAGLAYKLAEEILGEKHSALPQLETLACIGTIADVMPLLRENRIIVKNGLNYINQGRSVAGINQLLKQLGLFDISATEIAFKIGPILNAAGRMIDDGATLSLQLLINDNEREVERLSEELVGINAQRQTTVKEGMSVAKNNVASQCLFGDNPLIVFTTKDDVAQFHEGVVGILAGKLAEEYQRPVIVLTETQDGILKGSGRSYGNIHLKALLDTVGSTLLGYGGHSGAAGLSVAKDKICDFMTAIQQNMPSDFNADGTQYVYDLEIEAKDLADAWTELQRFAPFGEGNPHPIFKIKNVQLTPKAGKFSRTMGENAEHLKLFGSDFDVLVFGGSQDYADIGSPTKLNVIGTLSRNNFGGKSTLQIDTLDFEENSGAARTSLANLLAAKMKAQGF